MVEVDRSIANIEQLVASLPEGDKAIFERMFEVSTTVGDLVAPESMTAWIQSYFGSVAAVEHQQIVKITNLVTYEGSLFNELRAKRPIATRISADLEEEIDRTRGGPFSQPQKGTPADVFGRVEGEHSVTASNIAKYDGLHGLVIFDEHNPLLITKERVKDYIDAGYAWALRGLELDPAAKYFFFMWNCLWKAGASVPHGHAQVTLTKGRHYSKVEWLRMASLRYLQTYGSDYFTDLFAVHRSLDLAFEIGGVQVISYLTPIKEKEVLLIGANLDDGLKGMVYEVLKVLQEQMGVVSFNLAIYLPPLGPADEDWAHFPVMVRVVDRGDPMNRTSDFGAMELYASSVIASDPFEVARVLRSSVAVEARA